MNTNFKYATFTNEGGRQINEDSVGAYVNGQNNCYVLCDGLGGHGMGDVASSLVVKVFENQFYKTDDVVNFLGQTFSASQDILMAEQKIRNAKSKMKTTGVAIVTDDRNAYVGHIGDSRGYIFYKNKVRTRTLDHSIPQMLVFSREIKESQIRNHPERNMLLRVMGVDWDEPKYELMAPIPLKKCQAFLLCSDGFWEPITEEMILQSIFDSPSPQAWLEAMTAVIEKINHPKQDNNTAIVIFVNP